jgi:sterol 3beta-glucosyltransferase
VNVCILTVGTRGDVQPFLALALKLQERGHAVTLAAPANFRDFVESHGVRFAPLRADYLELAQNPDTQRMVAGNPMAMFKMMGQLQAMTSRMLEDCTAAAQGCDAIVYHPKTLAAPHLLEKFGIPGFAVGTVPILTPTAEFVIPGLFAPTLDLGATLNRLSYGFLSNFTLMFRKTIAEYRQRLGLSAKQRNSHPRWAGEKRLPVLYCFSQHVVPRPKDWDEDSHITGYWTMPPKAFTPDPNLQDFLETRPAPVYIGFGSMLGTNPEALTRTVLDAVKRSGVRAVLATGWGALHADDVPENVFALKEAPHEWLFSKVAAVVHHGGMGTTAAGLIAGKPTLICPFLVDQPFWGQRTLDLEVGVSPIPQKKLSSEQLEARLRQLVNDEGLRQRAEALGAKLRLEEGAVRACEIIESRFPSHTANG